MMVPSEGRARLCEVRARPAMADPARERSSPGGDLVLEQEENLVDAVKEGRLLVTAQFREDSRVALIEVGRAGQPWALGLRPDEMADLMDQFVALMVFDIGVMLGRSVTPDDVDEYLGEIMGKILSL